MSVQVQVRTHDKFRLEVAVFSHPQKKPLLIDLFWFFPKQLDITKTSYPKSLFYRYLNSNLRYRIPDQTLGQLASPVNPYMQMLVEGIENEDERAYLDALKLFSAVFVKALRKEIATVPADGAGEQLLASNRHTKEILVLLRAHAPMPVKMRKLGFKVVNEFCSSQMIQCYLHCIAELPDGEMKAYMLETVSAERDSRQRMGLSALDGKSGFVKTVQKLKLARRYCESVLFLETYRRELGVVTQQIVFSLAAAFSMMFAMLIAFWSQHKYGNFSTSFLIAMVLGYIVKDRLKELSREATYLRLSRYMFDYGTQLRSDLLQRKRPLGQVKEVVQFIKEKKLDKVIGSIHSKLQQSEKGLYESALMYRRRFKTNTLEMPKGIKQYADFSVFNLRKMLRNASYQDYSFYYQKGGKVIDRRVQPTYTVELVVRISGDGPVSYQRHHLTVTRKGIRDIREGLIGANQPA